MAANDGAVDMYQVIAAVDWVVKHRNDNTRNPIKVLNLSYGTDGIQDYRTDPLTHAVENAWRGGHRGRRFGRKRGFRAGQAQRARHTTRSC